MEGDPPLLPGPPSPLLPSRHFFPVRVRGHGRRECRPPPRRAPRVSWGKPPAATCGRCAGVTVQQRRQRENRDRHVGKARREDPSEGRALHLRGHRGDRHRSPRARHLPVCVGGPGRSSPCGPTPAPKAERGCSGLGESRPPAAVQLRESFRPRSLLPTLLVSDGESNGVRGPTCRRQHVTVPGVGQPRFGNPERAPQSAAVPPDTRARV